MQGISVMVDLGVKSNMG